MVQIGAHNLARTVHALLSDTVYCHMAHCYCTVLLWARSGTRLHGHFWYHTGTRWHCTLNAHNPLMCCVYTAMVCNHVRL